MGNKPSDAEIKRILARKRKAGQPAKKSTASTSISQQELKDSIVAAVKEQTASQSEVLAKSLKNLADSITAQRKQNKNKKGGQKMAKQIDKKVQLHKAILNMVNEGVLLPKDEKVIVDSINIDPVLQEFRLTHSTVVRYHVPDIVDGKMVYVEKEMETELNDRHVVQIDEHNYYQFGESVIVSAIEDEVNDIMNSKVVNYILTESESETATDIFEALSGMGKYVSKAIIITSPDYLKTILGYDNLLYKIYVNPYLGNKNAIVLNPKNIAVNFQIVNVGAKKRFDTGIFDVGFSLMNSGVAQIKAGGIFII